MGEIGKLSACLEMLGGFTLGTLVDRKLLQKKVYFLQEFGVDLGYSFGFYIYGPYSSELTNDAFFLYRQRTRAPDTIDSEDLSAEEEKSVQRAMEFFVKIKGSETEIARQLEFLSSLHFLRKVSNPEDRSRENIIQKLAEKKIIPKNVNLKEAWEFLVSYELMN